MSLTGNFRTDLWCIIPIHILPSSQVSSSKSIIKRLSGRMPAIKVSLQLKSIQVPPHLRHVVASRPLGSPHAPPELSGPWWGWAEWLTSLRRVSCHSCHLLHDFIFFSLRLCNLKKKLLLFLCFGALFIWRESSYSFEILRELLHEVLHDPQKMVLNYQGTTNELLTINTVSQMRGKNWTPLFELSEETQNSSTWPIGNDWRAT